MGGRIPTMQPPTTCRASATLYPESIVAFDPGFSFHLPIRAISFIAHSSNCRISSSSHCGHIVTSSWTAPALPRSKQTESFFARWVIAKSPFPRQNVTRTNERERSIALGHARSTQLS